MSARIRKQRSKTNSRPASIPSFAVMPFSGKLGCDLVTNSRNGRANLSGFKTRITR
jgi:hypothetical protein